MKVQNLGDSMRRSIFIEGLSGGGHGGVHKLPCTLVMVLIPIQDSPRKDTSVGILNIMSGSEVVYSCKVDHPDFLGELNALEMIARLSL
jgi:hypothetical protein